MASEAPPFWWKPAGLEPVFLAPFSAIYSAVAGYRLKREKLPKIDLPVLCVGNFTVGGSGKTPVAIALGHEARRRGLKPGFLTRGYGGSVAKPRLVDAGADSTRQTGDEPLLLAAHAPTAVAADRLAGASLLKQAGCDFVIMDDGFQSRRLHMDFAVMVVDTYRGIGNGHVIPGGPLRARLVDQLRRTDAVLTIGDGGAAQNVVRMAARAAKPVYQAMAVPRDASRFTGRSFLAFAGIGNPEKFFDTVAQTGGWLALTRTFGDHHPYTDEELRELIVTAAAMEIELVTTAKDAARLRHGSAVAREMLKKVNILEIGVEFDPPTVAAVIIRQTRERFAQRLLS